MKIKMLMEQKNISVSDLAEKLGISRITLSRSLNGHRSFKKLEIEKIMLLLDCSYEDFFNKDYVVIDNEKIAISGPTATEIKGIIKRNMEKGKSK